MCFIVVRENYFPPFFAEKSPRHPSLSSQESVFPVGKPCLGLPIYFAPLLIKVKVEALQMSRSRACVKVE